MNGNQDTQSNLVDTTDYLEAVGVCRCWKNFLFIIIIICLLLLQISFWLVDTGYVKAETVEIASSKTLPTLDRPAITPLEEEKIVASEQSETEQPIAAGDDAAADDRPPRGADGVHGQGPGLLGERQTEDSGH